jgi:FkbM family methyltransferase
LNNIEAHPEAIWSHSGQITLDLRENEPLQISSLAEEIQSGDGMSISVPSLSIADMFEKYQIDQCDLLKMDCEGAEYEIILNLNIAILNRVARIVMEYHNNVTSYTHSDLVTYLETRGYRVRITPNRVHDYLGYLYAERM